MALIILEGLDGSGKGTQADLLFAFASSRGPAQKISFPDYDSPSSGPVRLYLAGAFGKNAEDVNAYAASTFYAVDRFASYRMKWRDAYLAGETVIADRYVTSNIVFQLSKLPRDEWDAYMRWLEDLEYEKLGLPRPDRVLYLDVDPKISHELLLKRYHGDAARLDIHESDPSYLAHCRDCALYAAKALGWTVLNCTENGALLPAESIHEKIIAELEAYL